MNEPSQFGLIGVIYRPRNDTPWVVEDNRKALKSEFPCSTKADVLNKIAEILDDMHLPPARLDRDSEPIEVTVAVTMRVSLCDIDNQVAVLDLQRSVSQAVENAIRHHEQVGFDHPLVEIVSIKTVQVRTLTTE